MSSPVPDSCYFADSDLVLQPYWIQAASLPVLVLFAGFLDWALSGLKVAFRRHRYGGASSRPREGAVWNFVKSAEWKFSIRLSLGFGTYFIFVTQMVSSCSIFYSLHKNWQENDVDGWERYQMLVLKTMNSGAPSFIAFLACFPLFRTTRAEKMKQLEVELTAEDDTLEKDPENNEFGRFLRLFPVFFLIFPTFLPAVITNWAPGVILYIWIFLIVAVVALILFLVAVCLGEKKLAMIIYLRVLVFTLALLSTFANYAYLFYHGFEYLHVIKYEYSSRSTHCYYLWAMYQIENAISFLSWVA